MNTFNVTSPTNRSNVSFETLNEKQPAETSSAGCSEIQQHHFHGPSHGFARHFLQNIGDDVEPFHEIRLWNIQRR